MSVLNLYEPPRSARVNAPEPESQVHFFPVSIRKLVIMQISTFGFYTLVWHYKNWRIYRDRTRIEMWPLVRTLFNIFFTHALFRHVADSQRERDDATHWPHSALATLAVCLNLANQVCSRVSAQVETFSAFDLLSLAGPFLMLIPLIPVQKKINEINNDARGLLNDQFSVGNIVVCLIGLMVWGLVILGSLAVALEQLSMI